MTEASAYAAYEGRSQAQTDHIDAARVNALMAALGDERRFANGDEAPALAHWLYFWDVRSPSALGVDGHAARGDFLPPVALPRRMWAGGRLRFLRPLVVGSAVTRRSTIASVTEKHGRSGALVFVTVEHVLSDAGRDLIVEQQDIVYRDAPAPGATAAPPQSEISNAADWREEIQADPILLFRYSALTMNGHRIHYDRAYAVEQEGYSGLVVQGPLQATCLAALAGRMGGRLASFEFRGLSPAVDGRSIVASGTRGDREATLWMEQGEVQTMTAIATFSPGDKA